ncbi:hypothetical protein EZS27_040612, partial [termite gut metagenome]
MKRLFYLFLLIACVNLSSCDNDDDLKVVSEGQLGFRLEGKSETEDYANSVYVDLSNDKQYPVDRKSWNLGFYCGDDFKVVLNGAYETVATASNKTDITAVTLADANDALDLAASTQSQTGNLPVEVVDAFDGSLGGTVFGEISADDAKSNVFFVVSANTEHIVYGRPGLVRSPDRTQWYQVKVTRNGVLFVITQIYIYRVSVVFRFALSFKPKPKLSFGDNLQIIA